MRVIDPDAFDKLADWSGDAGIDSSFTFESETVGIEGEKLVVADSHALK